MYVVYVRLSDRNGKLTRFSACPTLTTWRESSPSLPSLIRSPIPSAVLRPSWTAMTLSTTLEFLDLLSTVISSPRVFTVRLAHPSHYLCRPSDHFVAIFRALDLKYNRYTLVKLGKSTSIEVEASVYIILNGIAGIPRLYTWCALNGEGYLSMQLCGVDLGKYVRENGPLSLEAALVVGIVVVSHP